MVDEDAAHHLRRQAEELRAILPDNMLLIDEAQIRLVHERGRLQGVGAPLAAQVGRGTAAKLLIDDRDETVARSRLASRPCAQKRRDLRTVSHLQSHPTPEWRPFP